MSTSLMPKAAPISPEHLVIDRDVFRGIVPECGAALRLRFGRACGGKQDKKGIALSWARGVIAMVQGVLVPFGARRKVVSPRAVGNTTFMWNRPCLAWIELIQRIGARAHPCNLS
ncbi:MAG: hypothetical protein IPM46_01245 [Flavobacteriales bacterium]|nr:hypothetical protein [Flavobacteriales bacterium]